MRERENRQKQDPYARRDKILRSITHEGNFSKLIDGSFVEQMEASAASDRQTAKAILEKFIASREFRRFIASPRNEAAWAGARRWVAPVAILPDALRDGLQTQTRILRLKASVARKQKKSSGVRGVALYAALQTILDEGCRRRSEERRGRIVMDGRVKEKSYRAVLDTEDNLPVLISLHRR